MRAESYGGTFTKVESSTMSRKGGDQGNAAELKGRCEHLTGKETWPYRSRDAITGTETVRNRHTGR